jgi:hypothetical protein
LYVGVATRVVVLVAFVFIERRDGRAVGDGRNAMVVRVVAVLKELRLVGRIESGLDGGIVVT